MSYLGYRICTYLSYRLLYIAIVFLPILGLAWFFRDAIRFPEHAITWPAFALSTLMAAGLQFFIAYSLAMIAFWVLEISTIVFLLYSFEYFLSGHIFPLDIMPAWFQAVMKWLPFTYELYFPAQVAMERIQGAALVEGWRSGGLAADRVGLRAFPVGARAAEISGGGWLRGEFLRQSKTSSGRLAGDVLRNQPSAGAPCAESGDQPTFQWTLPHLPPLRSPGGPRST